jgi:hypothetical protein
VAHHAIMRHRMPYFYGAYGMVCHRIPYFCGACTGAPQNSYFCGEDSVEHHPCATEYIYWCTTDEVFPTSAMECMVDGSSWSPQLAGRVGGIFELRLKYGHEI